MSLVLESKAAELQLVLKGPMEERWSENRGMFVKEPKQYVLQFDRYLFDLEEAVEQNEWTDEDVENIKAALDRQMQQMVRGRVERWWWYHEAPKPVLPWPKYEETHHNQIPTLADQLGLVNEAINYESRREGGPRKSVMEKLEQLRDAENELTAA